MSINKLKLGLACLVLVFVSSNAWAGWLENIYLHEDVGVAFVQNIESGPFGDKLSFSPGVQGGIGIGGNINKSLSTEFQTGIIWNQVDKIGFGGTWHNPDLYGQTMELYQFPLLLNCIYTVPDNSAFKPYWGVGLGGVVSYFSEKVYGGIAKDSDADFTFAYQVMAGLKYEFSPHAQIGIGYKFFGSLNHNWYLFGTDTKADPVYTHLVSVSFIWKF